MQCSLQKTRPLHREFSACSAAISPAETNIVIIIPLSVISAAPLIAIGSFESP